MMVEGRAVSRDSVSFAAPRYIKFPANPWIESLSALHK